MIPVAGIVVGAVWAVRAMNASGKGGGKRPPPKPGAGWVTVYVVVVCLALPAGLVILGGLLGGEPQAAVAGLPIELPLLALVFPWTITRLVLIPLGRYRLAYWLSHLAMVDWRSDPNGGSTAAAAWALLNRRSIGPKDLEWVEQKLGRLERMGGGGLLGTGLLCIARGDADGGRAVLESLRWLDAGRWSAASTPVKLAREFLAAEAASRGDWRRVLEVGSEAKRPSTFAGGLLAALARRLTKQRDAPAPFGLWLRWALAPHRLRTLPFVRRALEYRPQAELPADPPESPPDPDPLVRAIVFHGALPPGAADLPSLRLAAQLWDEALSGPGLPRQIADRTLALGGSSGGDAIDEMRRSVSADLAIRVRARGLPLSELGEGPTLEAISRLARNDLLEEVEVLSRALEVRVEERRALPAQDEWREFIALRLSYERAARCGGEELRRLAFPSANTAACSLAVWLWNQRRERVIPHAIFCWLRDEAERVGDDRTFQLQAKNSKLAG